MNQVRDGIVMYHVVAFWDDVDQHRRHATQRHTVISRAVAGASASLFLNVSSLARSEHDDDEEQHAHAHAVLRHITKALMESPAFRPTPRRTPRTGLCPY